MEFALCLLLANFVVNIAGYPSGAPVMVCESMTPGHMFDPQTSECPFVTHPEKTIIDINTSLKLTLQSREPGLHFKGFLLTALDEKSGRLLGTFNLSEGNDMVRIKSCDGLVQNMVTHQDNSPKNSVVVVWTPPKGYEGDVTFMTTFVQRFDIYWVKQKSELVRVVRELSNAIPDVFNIDGVSHVDNSVVFSVSSKANLSTKSNQTSPHISGDRPQDIHKNITSLIIKVPANRSNSSSRSFLALFDFPKFFRSFLNWMFS